MSSVNVAFIGAGQFAKVFHYSTLSIMEDVRIVAIADLKEGLLQETADRYGVPGRYTDYHEMLAREDADIVYIIMPPMGLRPIVLDVIAAGKHVFTEKPCGMNSAETAEMASAAGAAGVKSCVGCNRRYSPVVRKAREAVLERGPISEVLAEFHKRMDGEMFGMSVLHADGLHVVDPMRDMLGEMQSLHSHADHWYTQEGWDHSYNAFHALMRFESGATGIFTANRQCGARYERFEVHGRGISAYVRAPDFLEIFRDGQGTPEMVTGEALAGTDDALHTYGYYGENRHFIDCIKNDEVPLTNFADNARTMRLCDAIAAGEHVERLA